MARRADQVGLDSVWVGDHLLYRFPGREQRGPWEAWTTLAAVAAVTERVELGPLVASTSYHQPAMLAKQAETIDEISGGRLIMGLGAGWHEPEYSAFGFPYDHRVSRFEEAFTIIRHLVREGHVDFHGRFYDAADCTIDPRGPRALSGGIPLLVGSRGKRMMSIAVPHADMWNWWFAAHGNSSEGLAPLMAELDAACATAGRDPREIRRTTAVYVRFPGATAVAPEGLPIKTPPLECAPEDLARTFAAFGAAGVDHLQVVLDPITIESIELLGAAVACLRAL